MNINKQNSFNNLFLQSYKNKIIQLKLNADYLLEKLLEFEKKEINDNNVKDLIIYMLSLPYYENLKELNDIKKFKIMIETLKIIRGELIEIELYERLEKLKCCDNNDLKNKKKLLIN